MYVNIPGTRQEVQVYVTIKLKDLDQRFEESDGVSDIQ